nr:hypothetical protein [uncultured Chryseobacterium sp.]
MNRKQIKDLTVFLEKLTTDFGLEKFNSAIHYHTKEIYLPFPDDEEELNSYDVEELKMYYDQIDTLQIIDSCTVISERITQKVIEPDKNLYYYLYLGYYENFLRNGIILRIIASPLLIGLAAVKTKQYNEYNSPCSRHVAVEIIYPSKQERLSTEDEDKMLKAYFFEIANKQKISLKFSSFHLTKDDIDEENNNFIDSTKLEEYNLGMDLFIKANSSLSEDLKFLFYYKIYEYFAPIYSKVEAFELLKRKLDNVNSQIHDSDYMNSFFDLARKYDKSLRDKELVKSLINNAYDLVDLYHWLPDSVRNKKIKIRSINYKTNKDVLDKIGDILGDILYSTRNQIVHAKSNYDSTGMECPDVDLEELNTFMHKSSYSLIKWYNRLPIYQKI